MIGTRWAALMLLPMLHAMPVEAAPGPPRAVIADVPRDPVHPARTLAIEIDSHGSVMNGIIYVPPGPGPFPLVVLAHGLPGNEQNLDLAQALRRAGWAVLTYHNRGAFGSEGDFSIDNAIEDMAVILRAAHQPDTARSWSIDPGRIVVMGHSLGGLAAAHAARSVPDRLATVLIAPWDPSVLQGILAPLTASQLAATALDRWGDVSHGRLHGTTTSAIADTIVHQGDRWTLADDAAALDQRPLLVVLAKHDLASSRAGRLLPLLKNKPALTELDSDHSFNDARIALQTTILDWLATLPGAPH